MVKTELLAPARDYECAAAAIDYGADAIYAGGPVFGARRAAANSVEEIARIVDYARRYGVRTYAALNTVVFDHEIEDARRTARELIEAGVDALIIQDMAFLRMGLSGVEFHASTQTSNTTPEGAHFLGRSGFSRIILERGLTADQIRAIREATDAELECFVHGAICVCTSGKCYLSRSMGSRSGNRGECSQPCRLTYDLTDGNGKTLLRGKHLLSVRDFDLSQYVGELMDLGVTSFKIEGRLKDSGYVKNTVAYYRAAIDRELAARSGFGRSSSGSSLPDFTPDPAKSFSREASDYFLHGKRGGVASFDTPKSPGTPVGRVAETGRGWLRLDRPADLVAGDGITFFAGGALRGTGINRVEGERIFPNDMEGITPGMELRRNYDRRFALALERSRTVRRIAVTAKADVSLERISLSLVDEDGNTASACIRGPFETAQNRDKAEETLRRQLTKAGDTQFGIDAIEVSCPATMPFVTISSLNALRRDALEALARQRATSYPAPKQCVEEPDVRYPAERLDGTANVVNRLAAGFYRDHGVKEIEPGYDLLDSLKGRQVMTTPYCIRRETGRCPKTDRQEKAAPLMLSRGSRRYRLEFDCARCMMNIFEE